MTMLASMRMRRSRRWPTKARSAACQSWRTRLPKVESAGMEKSLSDLSHSRRRLAKCKQLLMLPVRVTGQPLGNEIKQQAHGRQHLSARAVKRMDAQLRRLVVRQQMHQATFAH